jgi:hypothetical protein
MMNEDRIREIANLASDHAESTADPFWDLEDGLNYAARLMKARDLKFAELIVKECADICINKNVSNIDLDVIRESGKFTLQDLATKSCGENLSKQIKEHFGVEE